MSNYKPELVPKVQGALSSSSSVSSTASYKNEPIASSSSLQPEIDLDQHQHLDHNPLIEQSKHVRFASSVSSLVDPLAVTQDEHLDPRRDGVIARMRSAMLRYGSAVAIGSAIGAGSLATTKHFFQNNNTQLNSTNTTQNDSIFNPF